MRSKRVVTAIAVLTIAIGAVPGLDAGAEVPGKTTAPHCAPVGIAGIRGAVSSQVDVLDSLAQVLPTQHQKGGSRAYLCQARNGFESFQIELTSPQNNLHDVRMTASDLSGPGHARIPATDVRLSREGYVRIRKVSDGELAHVLRRTKNGTCEGDCRFPDPLFPDVDTLYHEKRDAFPLLVPHGENRAVWVDVQVPRGQASGTYTGSITISREHGTLATVPITLTVLPTTLPSTSSVGGVFFAVLGGHRLPAGVGYPQGYRQLAELGLDNRITIFPDNDIPEQNFDEAFRPLLTGTDNHVLLPGARLTTFAVQTGNYDNCVAGPPGGDPGGPPCLQGDDCPTGSCHIEPAPGWNSSDVSASYSDLKSLGLGSEAFLYCDEYTPQDCADSYARTADGNPAPPLAAIDDPGIRGWPEPDDPATTVPSEFDGVASVHALIVEDSFLQDKVTGLDRIPAFHAWQQAGSHRKIWVYTACGSAGCDDAPKAKYSDRFTGRISYGIDQVASEQRAAGWQLFIHHLDGELYYLVNRQLHTNADLSFKGVNGDGNLLYPYTLAGGNDPIPLESIRLKRIRDGRQDYELLTLAMNRSTSDAHEARAVASGLFPTLYQSNVSASRFEAARTKIVAMLR